MDLASLELLQTPAGRHALDEAEALAPDESSLLACLKRLGKRHPATLARAAVTTAVLRRKALVKFSRAGRMFFEREALEQASSEVVARHRAKRFAGLARVADLCSGLGGDAIALAEHVAVVAVDLDPLRLRLCDLNLVAYDRRDLAHLVVADALTVPLAGVDAAFIDPDRRVDGRREVSFAACRPALSDVVNRFPGGFPICAKLAPGVPWGELETLAAEIEFISFEGELKECAVWFGSFRTIARQATLLPSGATLAAEQPAESPGCAPVGRYLYDPDPAVIRAGLVTNLAQSIGAKQLDPSIAYLSGDGGAATPFARIHIVEVSMPFHLGKLRDVLRQRGVGRVQVKRRGSAIDPEELTRKLRLQGSEMRTLVLTRAEGRPWVLVTTPEAARSVGLGTAPMREG